MKNLISSKLPSNKKEKKELELLEEKYYLDYIGDDGYVYKHNGKEYYRTNILLQGPKGAPGVRGKDGLIPRIGDNGNWFIGDKDTLVKAQLNTEEYATKQDLQNVEVKILETPDNSGNDGLILSVLNGKTVWINPANGSVVDNVISNTSENPVQNKVIKEYIDNNYARNDDNNTVISEAFAALQARIVALEKMLLDPNTLISLSVKSLDAQDIYICGLPEVITGNGAPTEVPRFIGQRYLDLSNDRVYTAFSLTNSTGDWK